MKRLLFIIFVALASLATAGGARAQAAWTSDRISVQVRGSGPDVVLVPGLASSRDVWNELAATLERDHRLHLVQLAGFAGEAPRANASGAVVAPVVDELARYIADAKLASPAVIGHSMGGAIALDLAARHPQAVGRVMVVDALPFFSLLFGPGMTPEQVRPQADAMRERTIAMTPEQFAAGQQRTMQMLVKSDAHRATAVKWSLESDRGTIARSMNELMTTDLRPELAKVRAPAVVLYAADASGPFPPERVDALYAAAYKDLAGVRLVRIEPASHFLMWDQPARFAQEVGKLLAAP